MTPEIFQKDKMIIAGMVYYGDPFHTVEAAPDQNEVGKLWSRFNKYYESKPHRFIGEVNPKVAWELHITTDEYEETKEYYVMVGVEVAAIEHLPLPIFAKVLPAGQYAVFTLKGEEMTANWGDAIYKEWLPAADYEEALQITIERYDEDRFTGWGDPDSEVEIWVPVREKAQR